MAAVQPPRIKGTIAQVVALSANGVVAGDRPTTRLFIVVRRNSGFVCVVWVDRFSFSKAAILASNPAWNAFDRCSVRDFIIRGALDAVLARGGGQAV